MTPNLYSVTNLFTDDLFCQFWYQLYPMALNSPESQKFLILRFSSIGDVTQCLSVPSSIHEVFPQSEIHWATRKDMSCLLENHPHLDRIWSYSKESGLKGLFKLALELRKENYTHIYDAHNNLRTRIIQLFLLGQNHFFIRRSLKRWKRFLLLRFHKNTFEMPFSGQRDLLEPLEPWGISKKLPPTPQLFLTEFETQKAKELLGDKFSKAIALAPSAAFQLKRWPKEYFKNLINMFPSNYFVLLGGPEDFFIEDIAQVAPTRCLNLCGKTNLKMSAAIVQQCSVLVANDTGLLHVAEQLGTSAIALMGPAPFGFPSREKTVILEKNLECRPCSKHGQGPCINKDYQSCMTQISVSEVAKNIEKVLRAAK